MVEEKHFQIQLAQQIDNFDLRGIFADWLEERGDWRAAGYRWLCDNRKRPLYVGEITYISGRQGFFWYVQSSGYLPPRFCDLPPHVYSLACSALFQPNWPYHLHQAEEAVCHAIRELEGQSYLYGRGRKCAVCGRPAVTVYPPEARDEWEENSCGRPSCDYQLQAAMDFHAQCGDR